MHKSTRSLRKENIYEQNHKYTLRGSVAPHRDCPLCGCLWARRVSQRRPGPRQFPWWGFGHGTFDGGSFGHQPFIAPHRFGHIDRFRSGIFSDVPPLWVAPEPYVEVTPVPPPVWYYCTNPPGYYPTVPSCTVPWTPVYPQRRSLELGRTSVLGGSSWSTRTTLDTLPTYRKGACSKRLGHVSSNLVLVHLLQRFYT